MLTLGLDAGLSVGAAVLHVSTRGTATWVASHVLDRAARVRDLVAMLDAHADIELVAVEAPAGHAFPGRVVAVDRLIEAAAIAGELVGTCRARGLVVVSCTANKVRAALCRKANASDAQVKQMLSMRLTLPRRSTSHERDAAAAALYAAMTPRKKSA